MAKFNGYKNWNHWNVALRLNNDEGLYRTMVSLCKRRTRRDAAQCMLEMLRDAGENKTPDGAPYSVSAIQSAMVGL